MAEKDLPGEKRQGWDIADANAGQGWRSNKNAPANQGTGSDLSTAKGIREYWFGTGPDLSTEEGIKQYWFGSGPDLTTTEGIRQYWFGDRPDLSTKEGVREHRQPTNGEQGARTETAQARVDKFNSGWNDMLEDHLHGLHDAYREIPGQENVSFDEFKQLIDRQR